MMNTYEAKAHTTRTRRQAAGRYETPAHKAAFAKMMQRGGAANLNVDDMLALSTHPALTVGQRHAFAAMAAKAQAAA